jgi:hypothetical protein
LQVAGLLATLMSCVLVTCILLVCMGPELLVRGRGDAAVSGTLLDGQGRPVVHRPVVLVARQADGRTYRAQATTDGTGGFRIAVPAAIMTPAPWLVYLEATLDDGTVGRAVVEGLQGGQTLRGRWSLSQSRP